MPLELRNTDGEVTLWSSAPVDVTLLVPGEGRARDLKATARRVVAGIEKKQLRTRLIRITRIVNTPDGRPGYLGLLAGLRVIRMMVGFDDRGKQLLFVTPGGTTIRLRPHTADFPNAVIEQARQWSADRKIAFVFQPSIVPLYQLEVRTYFERLYKVPLRAWFDEAGRWYVDGDLSPQQRREVDQTIKDYL